MASPSWATSWSIDAGHSKVGFSVRHMMVTNTHGAFEKYSGTVVINEKNPSKSKIDVAIEVGSINTGDKKRDEHLLSPDFFNAKKFPKMTFVSSKVSKKGAGYLVAGKLTIRGISKPVTLHVNEVTKTIKGPWGKTRRGASATTEINRTDFGLKWNKVLEAGGVALGEKVKIQLDLELIKS